MSGFSAGFRRCSAQCILLLRLWASPGSFVVAFSFSVRMQRLPSPVNEIYGALFAFVSRNFLPRFCLKKQKQARRQSAPSRTSCYSRFVLCFKRLICRRRFLTSLAAVKRTLFPCNLNIFFPILFFCLDNSYSSARHTSSVTMSIPTFFFFGYLSADCRFLSSMHWNPISSFFSSFFLCPVQPWCARFAGH